MAMSRSFDSVSLTTRASIEIVPPLTSSKPASMRSRVDLPHPEGPTSTMNSPSWMSKLSPWITFVAPNDFSMSLNETEAMASALDRAGGEAGDHVALERVVDRRRRQRIDQPGGHQELPWRIVGGEEIPERHRERDAPVVREQQERVQVFVPSEQQRVGPHRHERRRHQRQADHPEEPTR